MQEFPVGSDVLLWACAASLVCQYRSLGHARVLSIYAVIQVCCEGYYELHVVQNYCWFVGEGPSFLQPSLVCYTTMAVETGHLQVGQVLLVCCMEQPFSALKICSSQQELTAWPTICLQPYG